MIVSHQPVTVVNRWRRGAGARVVLELAIVVASCGAFGRSPSRGPKSQTYEEVNKYPAIYQTCINVHRAVGGGRGGARMRRSVDARVRAYACDARRREQLWYKFKKSYEAGLYGEFL